ncbi:GNAT family N-acetyltransferase [Streptomyces sp. NPDC058045]|uniref:GNAT family N-acetyltransferase n=1 Tax=Streptomyces sp. NPDC058045 TaxID=3346311 RepID=UPI0036E53842
MTGTDGSEALPWSELDGYGLRLRAWRDEDVPAVLSGMNDPEVQRWSVGPPSTMDERDALDWIAKRAENLASGRLVPYCVTDAATGEVLGSVDLHQVVRQLGHAGVGYWLLPSARGRGVVTRAVELAVRWAFGPLGLHRIDLGHGMANEASCRVAQRCGFLPEGVMRGFLPSTVPGVYHDTHLHARLATDPAPPIR